MPVQFTKVKIGSRDNPGCTKYQWPKSIEFETAPRNAAPIKVLEMDNHVGPPVSIAPAMSPIAPIQGAT